MENNFYVLFMGKNSSASAVNQTIYIYENFPTKKEEEKKKKRAAAPVTVM